jgi:hypothetical protein
MVEIPTPKPYIFIIRVTRQIKCLIAQALGVIPGSTLGAFHLSIHPDYKYIWFRGGDLNH